MTSKPVTILASEMRMMESKHTGRKYRIIISLPYMYAEPRVEDWPFIDAPAKWPVVYLLDANWYFGMVTDMIRAMAWCGNTTDAVVVGISYPENTDLQEDWREAFARRYIDFTPIHEEVSEKWHSQVAERPCTAGDAGNFLKFIKNEVILMVEDEYQIDPSKRILAGHSHGGLFTAFTLLVEPGLFRNYIIGSPSLSYGNNFIFKLEEQFAIRHKRLPANVYFSVGELEETADDTTLEDTLRFASILESRKYKGLSLHKQIFTDLNHCEVIAPGFQAGLKIALRKLQPNRV